MDGDRKRIVMDAPWIYIARYFVDRGEECVCVCSIVRTPVMM